MFLCCDAPCPQNFRRGVVQMTVQVAEPSDSCDGRALITP